MEAALKLLQARLLTRFIPARLWLPHSQGRSARFAASGSPVPAEIGRAVAKVARHLPFPVKCLPQAIAAQWMLRRRGIQATLVFGVRRNDAPERTLDFHAWLMFGREVIIGGHEVEKYSAFPTLGVRGAVNAKGRRTWR